MSSTRITLRYINICFPYCLFVPFSHCQHSLYGEYGEYCDVWESCNTFSYFSEMCVKFLEHIVPEFVRKLMSLELFQLDKSKVTWVRDCEAWQL